MQAANSKPGVQTRWHAVQQAGDSSAKGSTESQDAQSADEGEKHIILDWKGDPMTINPGDKLPFF